MIAPLLPEHLADLQKSGLSDATIAAAQIQPVCPRDLQALGPRYQSVSSAYRIPILTSTHIERLLRLKLFPTVKDRDGHTVKYHHLRVQTRDCIAPVDELGPHCHRPRSSPLSLPKGEKKALALAQLIPCLESAVSGHGGRRWTANG
jgi:hypothetical protein